jgi:hypothetical protein
MLFKNLLNFQYLPIKMKVIRFGVCLLPQMLKTKTKYMGNALGMFFNLVKKLRVVKVKIWKYFHSSIQTGSGSKDFD